jgi:hypothetical protein
MNLAKRKRRAVVNQLYLSDFLFVVLYQDILRLQVAMDYLRLAQQLQGLSHFDYYLLQQTCVSDYLVIQRFVEDLT